MTDVCTHTHSRRAYLSAAALLVGLLIATRSPALLSRTAIDDEKVYTVVATTMRHGGEAYVDAVERKPPLLFYLYDGVLAAAGDRPSLLLHAFAIFWVLATMALLAIIANGLFGQAAAVWAALLYVVFSVWGDYRNLALNGEILLNLPVVAALAIVFHRGRAGRRAELLVAGALIAVATLLKQPAIVAMVPAAWYVLHPAYRRTRGLNIWRVFGHLTLLVSGCVLTFLVAIAWLSHAHLLEAAWYWTVISHHVSARILLGTFLTNAPTMVLLFVGTTFPLIGAALASIGAGMSQHQTYWSRHRAEFAAMVAFLVVSLAAVAVNGQFLSHYFLLMIPALSLLGAPHLAMAWSGVRGEDLRGRRLWLAGWLTLTVVAELTLQGIGVARHQETPDVAQYVRMHSATGDRLFVWGQADATVGLYLDADRLPASRFIASYPLTGHVFSYDVSPNEEASHVNPDFWRMLTQDFERHPPRFVIDTEGSSGLYPISRYPMLRDYLARSYARVYAGRAGTVYQRRGPLPAVSVEGDYWSTPVRME